MMAGRVMMMMPAPRHPADHFLHSIKVKFEDGGMRRSRPPMGHSSCRSTVQGSQHHHAGPISVYKLIAEADRHDDVFFMDLEDDDDEDCDQMRRFTLTLPARFSTHRIVPRSMHALK